MPAPAVYMPQRTLPPDTRGMWGFEPMAMRPGARPLPVAACDRRRLAAHITGPASMHLLAVPAAAFTGSGQPVAVDDPQLLASGHFAEPHPPEWIQAACDVQSLPVVIGPDDFPRLMSEHEAGGDVGKAVSNLWIFKSAVAVVHLVAPGV
jgi:hypothetical protein